MFPKIIIFCLALTLPPTIVKRVIDGDTFVVHHYGHGYRGNPEDHIRVRGLETPEAGDSLYFVARDSTEAWLQRGTFQTLSCGRDNFGRDLPWVWRGTDSLHVHISRLGLGTRR